MFIYQLEANPRYHGLANTILEWIEGPHGKAVTSTVTMLEILVQPYRLGDIQRVNSFYALLSTYPHLQWLEPTLEIADRAAKLRADHGLRTPDALQIATALEGGSSGFVSNDTDFGKVTELDVLILDDLLSSK